jgi:hypothetical protein
MNKVETIISGAGVVEDMRFSKEVEIVDPTPALTERTASCLQMNNICTLDPGTACAVGKLVTNDVLDGSTKNVGGPWSQGRTLHAQGAEATKIARRSLVMEGNLSMEDGDGFVKSGNQAVFSSRSSNLQPRPTRQRSEPSTSSSTGFALV